MEATPNPQFAHSSSAEGAVGIVTPGISIWRVDLSEPAAVVERAAKLLTPDERERAGRGTAVVRRRRLVARAALRIALARWVTCAPAALRFATDPSGKPRLAGPGPHFSVASSGDWSLIAVTSLGPIGIDIERVVALAELEGIVARRFAPEQARAILNQNGERRLQAFYRCWTRLEAHLKATGVGLARGLDTTVGDPDPRAWTVASVNPGRGLIGAVVVGGVHPWRNATLRACPLVLDYDLVD
jgi:4'-phosphopantetheinyl transferase